MNSNPANLESVLGRVKGQSRAFAQLPVKARRELVAQLRAGYQSISEESVRAACRAKGIDPDGPLAGEEWVLGPMIVLRGLRLLERSLQDIERFGAPRIPRSWTRTLDDGRLAVKVFPASTLDRALLLGHRAEVWMKPGVSHQNLAQHQASFYRQPHEGRLCVVLGAGNVNAIPALDVVHKLFVEGSCCVLKLNPVNDYLAPLFEKAFAAAIERGFLAVLTGDGDLGAWLVQHPAVDEVHITGSDQAFNSIVWGPPGPEREVRKEHHAPVLKKRITSELGNISPMVLVPGEYSDAELEFQARSVAGSFCNNASFNCIATKLLVTPRDWPPREKFLALLRQATSRAPLRKAYYPGASERWARTVGNRARVHRIGNPTKDGELPWAVIEGVDALSTEDPLFRTEPWCGVLAETSLPGTTASAFLEQAAGFLKDRLWGTLCANFIVPRSFSKDVSQARAFQNMLLEMRYGTVCVNTWAGAVFAVGTTPWGGHPSSTMQDVQSGQGWVHNTFMLEDIEKVVMTGPLRGYPVPPWFPGHRGLLKLGKALARFENAPRWRKLPGLAWAALRA